MRPAERPDQPRSCCHGHARGAATYGRAPAGLYVRPVTARGIPTTVICMTPGELTGLPSIISEDGAHAVRRRVRSAPEPAKSPAARLIRPRDEFVTAWLLLLVDRGATYGYELRGELEAHAISIDSAVVYRTLRRLEADGLVKSRWIKSGVGPRRRSYDITPTGTRQLDDVAGVIGSVRDLHDRFLEEHSHAVGRRAAPPPS